MDSNDDTREPSKTGAADFLLHHLRNTQFLQVFPPQKLSERSRHESAQCIEGPFHNKFLTEKQKKTICEAIRNENVPRRFLVDYLGISNNRVKTLLKQENAHKYWHCESCRPYLLDHTSYCVVSSAVDVTNLKAGESALTKSQFAALVAREAAATDVRRGGNGLNVDPCPHTIQSIKDSIPHAVEEKGQTMTKARARESYDVRNFVTMAVMNECFAKGKHPQMIANCDASTFKVEFTHNEPVIAAHEKGCRPASVVGYLVRCRKRPGNKAMYTWFFRTLLIPFAAACRACLPPDDREQRMYLVMDGEDVQLQALDDDALAAEVVEAGIDVGKGPASCSHTCGNACDRAKTFQAGHRVMHTAANPVKQDQFHNAALEVTIETTLAAASPTLSAAQRSRIATGCSRLMISLSKVLNPSITQHGFARTGAFIPSADGRGGGPSAEACLKCCYEQISRTDLDRILGKMPDMCALFAQNNADDASGSQLTEEQMNTLGVARVQHTNDRRTAPKDTRAQSNQRAILVTGAASRERRKAYLQARDKKKANAAARRAAQPAAHEVPGEAEATEDEPEEEQEDQPEPPKKASSTPRKKTARKRNRGPPIELTPPKKRK